MTRVRVATYNLYLGADVSLLFGVNGEAELAERVDVVRRQLDATRFPERAAALASLLARERPHFVGLQEVARWSATPVSPDGSLGEEREIALIDIGSESRLREHLLRVDEESRFKSKIHSKANGSLLFSRCRL